MKPIKSKLELRYILSEIEMLESDIATFLDANGYEENEYANMTQLSAFLKFEAGIAENILFDVYRKQKDQGHLQTAVEAMELRLRLAKMENRIISRSMQQENTFPQ